MDFTLAPEIEALRQKVRAFITDEVLPLEADRSVYDQYENIKLDVLSGLRAKAKKQGLWAPQMPRARGGPNSGDGLGGLLRRGGPLDLRAGLSTARRPTTATCMC